MFEGVYLFCVGLFVSFTPGKYFSSKLYVIKNEDGEEHVEKKKKDKVSIFEMRKSIGNEKKEKSSFFDNFLPMLIKIYVVATFFSPYLLLRI